MISHRRKGFTLIELLVVISIMSLLIALLLPALSEAKKSAQGAKCLNNLKQIAVANASYMNFNNQAYPRPFAELTDEVPYGATTSNPAEIHIRFMFHHEITWNWGFGAVEDPSMLSRYVNDNPDVFHCPMYWATRVLGPVGASGVAQPIYSNRSLLPDYLEQQGWSYGINANLKGLEKAIDAGDILQHIYYNSPFTIYEYDVKRPGTTTAYADSNSDEDFSAIAPPSLMYSQGPNPGWWDPAFFLQDNLTTWVGQHVGSAHNRSNLGYNCVFTDGHGENPTAASHYDIWTGDDTYWTLDGRDRVFDR
jgi:prepilin-type N-terminal cleavage/methylation domain-containing protein